MTLTPPVLSYAMQVTPSPLLVSLAGENASYGAIQLVVTNQTNPPTAVTVTSITVTVQIGSDASDLIQPSSTVSSQASPSTWSVTPPSSMSGGPAAYVLVPTTGSTIVMNANDSVTLLLYDFPLNAAVGTTSLSISEVTDSGTGSPPSFAIAKFPYGFYFNSLVACQNGVPVAQVQSGSSVTLTWNGSSIAPTAYSVLYNDSPQQPNVTTVGEWTSPQLFSDTVFVVQVTAGTPAVTYALSTAVSVASPNLDVNDVTVAGTLTASGSLALNGPLNALQTPYSFPSLYTTGTLSQGGPVDTYSSTYSVATDGFIVGFPGLPGDYTNGDTYDVCLFVNANGMIAEAGIYSSVGFAMPTGLMLPISAGSSFTLNLAVATANTYAALYGFWWVAFGDSSAPTQVQETLVPSTHGDLRAAMQSSGGDTMRDLIALALGEGDDQTRARLKHALAQLDKRARR